MTDFDNTEPGVQNAALDIAEKLAHNNASKYFDLGLHEIDLLSLNTISRYAAERLASKSYLTFIRYELHKRPEFNDIFYNMMKTIEFLHPEQFKRLKSYISRKGAKVLDRIISKRAKEDKPKAGIFMKLPRELAKQFSSLGEHDDSTPHVTALFIGLVPEDHEILLEEVVRRIAMEHDPFELALDEKVSYFPATKHSDDCKIAKLNIISTGLRKLHKALKNAITNAKMDIDDHFPDYKPHVTLEYMEPQKEKYDTDIPSGSWTADKIEIWNGDKKTTISLGRKKRASIYDLSANKPVFSIREVGVT